MPKKSDRSAAVLEAHLDGRTKAARAIKAAAAERERIAAGLLDSLNRKPNELDRLAVKLAASLEVEIDTLEREGRDPFRQRQQLLQLLRGLGIRPAPVAPKSAPSVDELFAEIAAETSA